MEVVPGVDTSFGCIDSRDLAFGLRVGDESCGSVDETKALFVVMFIFFDGMRIPIAGCGLVLNSGFNKGLAISAGGGALVTVTGGA